MSETSYRPTPVYVTVDILVFTAKYHSISKQMGLQVLLVQRKYPPFQHHWAIPGGFVEPEESAECAAYRELQEETGLQKVYLEQLYTFSKPDRDPRGRAITIAYLALASEKDALDAVADDDAEAAEWFWVEKEGDSLKFYNDHESFTTLAFDHNEIIDMALMRLRNKVWYTPVAFSLLEKRFTTKQLRDVYSAILGVEIDAGNFRKSVMKLIEDTGETVPSSGKKPAHLYKRKEETV